MLHNLFHSLPCIHSQDSNPLTLQIWPAPQHMWPPFLEYSLPAWYVFEQIHLPSFHDTWYFFWHHRFNAYTHSLSQKFILLESLISRPVSSLLPVHLLSSLHFFFFCTAYILAYQPIIDIYGFANFPFFWYTKIPYAHYFSLSRHICGYCFYFFLRLNNVLPSFSFTSWIASLFLLVSSASSAPFFFYGATHSLLSLAFYVCWLISIHPPLFAWTSCTITHTTPLPCTVTTKKFRPLYFT